MAAAVLAGSRQQGKMGPLAEPRTPSTSLMPKDSLRSTSTTSSAASTEKIGIRVGVGGRFVTDAKGQVKYVGGTSHLDSIPVSFKYADLVFRLTEKVNGAVSIKYLLPGDELDEDNLIGVWDDADVQEMYDEYMHSAQLSGALSRAPRLKVFLFPATEEDASLLTPEQDLEGYDFFESTRYAKPGAQPELADGTGSSLDSSFSSGGAGGTPGNAAWHQGSSRPSTHPSGMGMQDALSDIENNPFVAPWYSPGSEDTFSDLSSAMQRCMVPPASRNTTIQPEHGHAESGGNKENSFAAQLPSHLSAFGEGLKLPSHISIFGDSCSSSALHQIQSQQQQQQQQEQQQMQMQVQQQQQQMQQVQQQQQQQQHMQQHTASKQPGLVGWGVMEAIGHQQPSGGHKHAEWQGLGGSPNGHEIWPPLKKAPSWMRIYSSITHVPRDAVIQLGSIAEGAFGEVSIARTPQFREVAIKWLKTAKVDRHQTAFWREAELLSKLNHPNVLRMYGVVCESSQDPTIVGIMTEFIKGGSLTANLRSRRALLPLLLRAQIAVQIAQGMAYLHECNVVHFDLKPDNLLLDGLLQPHGFVGQASVPCVKVADFGLSKEKRQSYVSGVRDLRGTLPFMAPELVNDPDRVTEKADVWSMGMLMWELLTLCSPFQDMAPQVIIAGLTKGTLRPDIPPWCEPSWTHLMHSCWALDPAQRPSFRSMALELEHLLHLLAHAGS